MPLPLGLLISPLLIIFHHPDRTLVGVLLTPEPVFLTSLKKLGDSWFSLQHP